MHAPHRNRWVTTIKDHRSAARHILLPLQRFLHTETTGALILLAAALAALIWANAPFSDFYVQLWDAVFSLKLGSIIVSHTLREWVNEELMTVFFFVVGLEIKRELVRGELSDWRRASLPVICALGGMLVPAALYAAFNTGRPGENGWGIPMATDIAFAIGVLALLGDRIPSSARIFLLTLPTVDDIGAILVIALFYANHLSHVASLGALSLVVLLVVMRKERVQRVAFYTPVAIVFWFAVLESGVHATIAGVVLGLLTPTVSSPGREGLVESAKGLISSIQKSVSGNSAQGSQMPLRGIEELTISTEAPADRLVRVLHPWSSYVILPLFALANAGVSLKQAGVADAFSSAITHGAVAGLLLGKPIGISLAALLAVRLRVASPIAGLGWPQVLGIGLLAGIGFTVSLFITDLAFIDETLATQAKVGVLVASLFAATAGHGLLRATLGRGSKDVTRPLLLC